MGVEIYLRICSAFCFAGSAIAIAAFFYTLSRLDWKNTKLHTTSKLTKENYGVNGEFFLVVTNFLMAILCILLCAYELILLINPIRFKYSKNGYVRFITYLLVGFVVMGVSAVLGISAGIINLVSAIITLINTILIKCGCFTVKKEAKSKDEI